MDKINNYNHWSDKRMNANDIMRFISDNNLLHIHSDLWKVLNCSSEINIYFLNFFKVLKERWENFDEKMLITNILKRPGYNNEKDLVKFLDNLIKLASKRDKRWRYFIPPKYVKILADFKNLPDKLGSLQKKKQIEELIYAIEQWWLPSSALDDFYGWATSCILDCVEINPLILSDIRHMKAAKWVSDKLDFSKGLNYFIPEYESEAQFRLKEQFKHLTPGSLVRFKNVLNACDNWKVFVVDVDSYRPLKVDWETLLSALWPVWRFYIEQAHSGTCYQLAWYISMMQNPHFYSRLLSCLEKNGDSLIVSLPSHCMKNNLLSWKTNEFRKIGHTYKLFVKLDDNWKFNSLDEGQTVKAKPFYQSLEHLYWKYRKYDYADKFLKQFNLTGKDLDVAIDVAIKNIDNYIYKFEWWKWVRYTLAQINDLQKIRAEKQWEIPKFFKCVEDYYKESWYSFEMFDMFWAWSAHWNVLQGSNVTYSNVKKLLLYTQDGYWRTFWTKPSSKKSVNWKREVKILPKKWLYSSHGYSICDYDPKTDIVKYINPWNSAFVFQMKLSELVKYLSEVSAKEIV